MAQSNGKSSLKNLGWFLFCVKLIWSFLALGLAVALYCPDVVTANKFTLKWIPGFVRMLWNNYKNVNWSCYAFTVSAQFQLGQIVRMLKTGDDYSAEEFIGGIPMVIFGVIMLCVNGGKSLFPSFWWGGPILLVPCVNGIWFLIGYAFHASYNLLNTKVFPKKTSS